MNVNVNDRPKTETAEDNPILFLEEKLEKKGSLEENDIQYLFQGAGKNPEPLPSLSEFVWDSRKNKNNGAEELNLKKRSRCPFRNCRKKLFGCCRRKKKDSYELPLLDNIELEPGYPFRPSSEENKRKRSCRVYF